MPPLFSIITITKNNPHGFEKTKKSLQSQMFHDYEWVVIDGEAEPDAGIYDAMNKGIDRVIGDYIVFMNAGDEFYDKRTLCNVAACLKGADFIYGDSIDGGHIKPASTHKAIARGMFTHHQAMYYRRDKIDGLQFDLRFEIAADYKFTAQFLKKTDKVRYIPKPLCLFESNGISFEKADIGRHEQIIIRRELEMRAPLTPLRQWAGMVLKRHCPCLYHSLKKLTLW